MRGGCSFCVENEEELNLTLNLLDIYSKRTHNDNSKHKDGKEERHEVFY